MLFARLVVHEHALLDCDAGQCLVDVLCRSGTFLSRLQGQLRGYFKSVVCVAAIPAGVAANQSKRIVIGGKFQCAQPALAVLNGTAQQRCNLVFCKRLQHVDAAAGEQRGDDLEGRIFGGCSDQPNCSALHVGQECILLCLVEAMDFIDEQDGARVHL